MFFFFQKKKSLQLSNIKAMGKRDGRKGNDTVIPPMSYILFTQTIGLLFRNNSKLSIVIYSHCRI